MTRGKNFMTKGRWKNNQCSAMSNQAWCDLKSKCGILKLHDICHNSKCRCQKQITFKPREFQMEGAGFKNRIRKNFKGTENLWNIFNEPGLK